MDYRSPLDNVLNFISGLPQGHDKPVKHALYNAVALFILFLCCAAGYALFVILGPFMKPLIWALLVGSVLHPFKSSLAKRFQSWFDRLQESNTPLLIGIAVTPINMMNKVSEFIGDKLLKHLKILIAVAITIPLLHVVYYYTPKICICLIWRIGLISHGVINFIVENSTVTIISLVVLIYFSLLYSLWTPENNKKFHIAACIIWLLISCCISQYFGVTFQSFIFIMLQVLLISGLIYEVYTVHEQLNASGQEISFMESFKMAFDNKNYGHKEEIEDAHEPVKSDLLSGGEQMGEEKEENKIAEPWVAECKLKDARPLDFNTQGNGSDSRNAGNLKDTNTNLSIKNQGQNQPTSEQVVPERLLTKRTPSRVQFRRSYSQPHVTVNSKRCNLQRQSSFLRMTNFTKQLSDADYASDVYLYSLLWACGFMLFWKNFFLLPILPIPLLIYIVKHTGNYFGLWNWLYGHFSRIFLSAFSWCQMRLDAFIPLPIRGLYKIMQKSEDYIKANIKESIDTISSCVVILGLLVFVICSSIFIVVQVYSEAITLVQMTSNVINQTVVNNPDLQQLLPPSFDNTVDSILDNAYQYGREGISKLVKGMVSDVESEKSVKLEKQVLDLWDRIYQKWMSPDAGHGPFVTTAAVFSSWEMFVEDIKKSPELFNLKGITEFVKQNIGTFMSLLESVWSILKGNISLILSSFSTFVSVLLGGGTVVLNFILNVIVFLTTLFYLLSSSGDLYKPVELMTNLSPSGNRFAVALEGAISGVFTASFKMAAFYGLWTWFIHNLFNVQIVYLPSAFAAILGAIPFLGTYWAGIPAVLDLWLAQGKSFQAILFAIFQCLPMSMVDSTIYNEIQGGGHPYLTGLAIAGGIFCLGVEGAIFGPLLLCGVYVCIDLSSSLFKESPLEEPLNIANMPRLDVQST